MNTTDARGAGAAPAPVPLAGAMLAWALLAGAPAPGHAQLNVVPAGALAFGRFAVAGPGSVKVDAHGNRSAAGGVLLLPSAAAPARFTVSDKQPANASLVAIVSLPAQASISTASSSMQLTEFTSAPAGGGVLAGASGQLAIGATLQVRAGQAAGNYSGSFHITIEYQ